MDTLHVTPHRHSASRNLDPFSGEAELEWLPILGPTAFLLARRITSDAQQGYFVHDIPMLAQSLGVGPDQLRKSIQRLRRYGLLLQDRGAEEFKVPDPWPHPGAGR